MNKNGILITNKPVGMSSFQMCSKVKRELGEKKVGHIGTLDPLASGVLPILVGKATKFSEFLVDHDKEYIATLHLGVQTDTGDSEGNVIKEQSVDEVLYENINSVLNSFVGESTQIPPMYSALKVNGKKLYELAREGKTIERAPRKIIITSIELLDVNKNNAEITFKVNCSKGTYIRTLCEDIADKLGTCGYMKSLNRTRVGNFLIEDAGKFIELKDIFQDIPKVNVDNIEILKNGMSIKLKDDSLKQYSGFINLYFKNEFIGIGKAEKGYYKRFIVC